MSELAQPGPTETHVLTGSFFRRRGRSVHFAQEAAATPPEPVRRPAKVAQMLALAHHLAAAIERGELTDQASIARTLGLTRARISQLLDLTLLAPAVQEAVLGLEAVDGREPLTERRLRGVLRAGDWGAQGEAWNAIALALPRTS